MTINFIEIVWSLWEKISELNSQQIEASMKLLLKNLLKIIKEIYALNQLTAYIIKDIIKQQLS